MALAILMWDLPPQEKTEHYNEKARNSWIPTILKQPGVKEFRGYRNPCQTTPQVLTCTEFDSMESWLQWASSEEYANLIADMRAVGCTGFSSDVWEVSPLVPKPLTPSSSI